MDTQPIKRIRPAGQREHFLIQRGCSDHGAAVEFPDGIDFVSICGLIQFADVHHMLGAMPPEGTPRCERCSVLVEAHSIVSDVTL